MSASVSIYIAQDDLSKTQAEVNVHLATSSFIEHALSCVNQEDDEVLKCYDFLLLEVRGWGIDRLRKACVCCKLNQTYFFLF